jgi:uncharacterized repeat protein (TIGR01451 family)
LLALVAVTALMPVYTVNAQDQSRLCLTQALVHGRVSNDPCLQSSIDKSIFDGHLYSDKAPGMSVLEIVGDELVQLPPVDHDGGVHPRIWMVRLLASGLGFLLGAFLIGRVAEGLAPGRGGIALVAFALGTLFAPLAAANFGHGTAGAVALGAFLLAWRGRFVPAGLVVGAALLIEYQTAAILIALAAYSAFKGARAAGSFVAGTLPGIALLGAYNTAAFGSPWHLSYRYVAGHFATDQAKGFFGIGAPRLHSIHEVFVGSGGLLLLSPVLVLAAWGLVLLARTYALEAAVCAVVTAFFVLLNIGYFLPYGGVSPGPRFLVPALPFLAVGLGPAAGRAPRLTALFTVLSVIPTFGMTLAWTANEKLHQTIWGEVARVAVHGRAARLVKDLAPHNAIDLLGIGPGIGLAVMVLSACAALVIAIRPGPWPVARVVRSHPWLVAGCAVVVAALVALVAVHLTSSTVDLRTSIHATATAAFPGDEVDFAVTVENPTQELFRNVVLTIQLPDGMQLLGKPFYERGSGCTATVPIKCNLDFLEAGKGTNVRLGARIAEGAASKLKVTARATSEGVPGNRATFVVSTGSA